MTNHPNRSMIKGLTVASKMPVIVYGSVRGMISEHRTVQAARKRLDKDQRDCRRLGGGAYSDANIYVWGQDRWLAQPGATCAD